MDFGEPCFAVFDYEYDMAPRFLLRTTLNWDLIQKRSIIICTVFSPKVEESNLSLTKLKIPCYLRRSFLLRVSFILYRPSSAVWNMSLQLLMNKLMRSSCQLSTNIDAPTKKGLSFQMLDLLLKQTLEN